MADNELQRLRAELRKRRNAATAKINRIRKSTGINLEGTQHDPRPKPESIARYTKAQVRAQMRKIDSFTNRDTAFVPGARGVPIPKVDWDNYKAAEKRVGAKARTEFDKVADIFIPHLGVTVGQRDRFNRTDRPRASGEASVRAFPVYQRDSKEIPSVQALRKLTDDLNRRTKPGYFTKYVKAQREVMSEMLKVIGDDRFQKQADALSDHQFNVLWNFEDLASRISERYEIMKAMASGRKDTQFYSQLDNNESVLDEIFNMAANLPRRAPRKTR